MENIELKKILDRFFENETQKILVLKGRWGVGKTYFWENFIKIKREEDQNFYSLNAYSYASLFGVSNLPELQNKILISTEILNESGYTEIIKKQNKNINRFIKGFFNIPFIKKNVYDFSPFLHNMIQSQLICFDDLERCHENFSIETLMGYADELVQKRKCKVIVIFNEEQLEDDKKEIFNQYREKIVDIEVTYAPSLENNFDVAFKGTNLEDDWRNVVRERCLLLKIDNIRVLKKIRYALEAYWAYIQNNDFPVVVRDLFIERLVSFYSLYLEEKRESYRVIKDSMFAGTLKISDVGHRSYLYNLKSKERDETCEEIEDRLFSELLKKYALQSSSMFDDEIMFYINNGYISSYFTDAIAKSEIWCENLKREEKTLECKNKISKVWDLYHLTLQDNLDDIIKVLDDLIEDEDIFDYLNIQDFFQFIKNFYYFQNLKDNGYNVQDIYLHIDKYIIKNKHNFLDGDIHSIFISIDITSFNKATTELAIDDYAKEEIGKLISNKYQSVEILDILKKLYDTGFSSQEEKKLFEKITKEQYLELFKNSVDPVLTLIIRKAYSELKASGKSNELKDALDEIAEQSQFNANRVAVLKGIG